MRITARLASREEVFGIVLGSSTKLDALVLTEPINSGIVGNRSAKLALLVEVSATSHVRDET